MFYSFISFCFLITARKFLRLHAISLFETYEYLSLNKKYNLTSEFTYAKTKRLCEGLSDLQYSRMAHVGDGLFSKAQDQFSTEVLVGESYWVDLQKIEYDNSYYWPDGTSYNQTQYPNFDFVGEKDHDCVVVTRKSQANFVYSTRNCSSRAKMLCMAVNESKLTESTTLNNTEPLDTTTLVLISKMQTGNETGLNEIQPKNPILFFYIISTLATITVFLNVRAKLQRRKNKKLLNANRRRLPEDFRETSQTYHNDVNSKYQGSNYDNQVSSYQGREKDSNYDADYQINKNEETTRTELQPVEKREGNNYQENYDSYQF